MNSSFITSGPEVVFFFVHLHCLAAFLAIVYCRVNDGSDLNLSSVGWCMMVARLVVLSVV